jgi:ubiquinone/menaquinone biosynthesis C-methylase UbiE
VLAAVPPECRRALDVGCGDGLLASELARRCGEVVGIDVDTPTLARARGRYGRPNLTFIEADVMSCPFEPASFDFMAAIATLHHLPLEPALERFSQLLRPGGVLSVIGLYRLRTLTDFSYACAAMPVNWWLRLTKNYEEVAAPIPGRSVHVSGGRCGLVGQAEDVPQRDAGSGQDGDQPEDFLPAPSVHPAGPGTDGAQQHEVDE